MRLTAEHIRAIDGAIDASAERAFAFLERLVSAPSTVFREEAAQAIVAEELERLGFSVERIAIADALGQDDAAGVPQGGYDGRFDIVGNIGRSAAASGRSLLLNGHVDVVPADEPDLWERDPFRPFRDDGWLVGRGTGDMKGGFAMAALALEALTTTHWIDAVPGRLTFLSVIEEECTGNGTLAAARAGLVADAVVLPEPTNLELLLAGVGVLWIDVTVEGLSAHAHAADRAVNAAHLLTYVIDALRELEREMNAEFTEPSMPSVSHPYNVNIGVMHAGDWPSSVPARGRLGVRVGFPTEWSPSHAEKRVRAAISHAAVGHAWLREHVPQVDLTGFRAQGYALDPHDPLVRSVAAAHRSAHGYDTPVTQVASTTDARIYLNQFGIPALCYGPRVRNIHGIDEAVELQSIIDGARTLARFLFEWFDEAAP
jgi:acetylornithine deacetylase